MALFPFPYRENVPLQTLSTMRVGGEARFFAHLRTEDEMQQALLICKKQALPFLVIGKGSNSLFDDRGFRGLVILNGLDWCCQENEIWKVGSGFSFARLGHLTAKASLQGLEFACGIPATVGGAIFMNAGANGLETADCLKHVVWISPKGERLELKKEELNFGYRSSAFQKMGGILIEGEFHLHFSKDVQKRQKKYLSARISSQPYRDPSCGCIFRNPLPYKAGQLIEECGLKGKRIGGIEVSLLHANFFVNKGEGTSQNVLDLIELVKEKVWEKKGIQLQEEVKVLPYE